MRVNSIPFEASLAMDSAAVSRATNNRPSDSSGNNKAPVSQSAAAIPTAPAPEPVVNGLGLGLEFSIDKETGVRVIKVLNVESGEVVRQIPPDEILAFLRHFDRTKGIFLSRRL